MESAFKQLDKLSLGIIYGLLLICAPSLPLPIILSSAILAVMLIWISVVDLSCFEIPDLAVVIVAFLGLGTLGVSAPEVLATHILTALTATAISYATGELAYRKTGREYLGIGDAKLIGSGTVWIGWPGLPEWIFIASIAGIFFAIVSRFRHSLQETTGVPFGPFLSLGLYIVWLYGPISF